MQLVKTCKKLYNLVKVYKFFSLNVVSQNNVARTQGWRDLGSLLNCWPRQGGTFGNPGKEDTGKESNWFFFVSLPQMLLYIFNIMFVLEIQAFWELVTWNCTCGLEFVKAMAQIFTAIYSTKIQLPKFMSWRTTLMCKQNKCFWCSSHVLSGFGDFYPAKRGGVQGQRLTYPAPSKVWEATNKMHIFGTFRIFVLFQRRPEMDTNGFYGDTFSRY